MTQTHYSQEAPFPAFCAGTTLLTCADAVSLGDFPAPEPRKVSELGTREEQRRIYQGPRLSDRATGGPDAGPLIERFSCLFKDREWGDKRY